MERVIYSVNDINKYIKNVLTMDESLKYIYVKGEISNFKKAVTGHLYFSLKDDDSLINAIMFNNYASKLEDEFKSGDEVVVLASIDAYVPRGTYQLFVYEMHLEGKGSILEKIEKLKKQLAKEGLFDESRKRNINLYPTNIGIITAKNSAAIKDLLFNINRRYPMATIYFFPSSVQGESAPKELLEAFNKSQSYPLDTLIIGRGGGANEDLNAFNDESLVRAVATSKMPVISAVGHEIDSTLLDFVADKKASTPTAAAELATVDIREIEQKISYMMNDMSNKISSYLEDISTKINDYYTDFKDILLNKVNNCELRFMGEKKRLNALNPKNILERGYALIEDESGKVISSVNDININQIMVSHLKDGTIISTIKEKR